jgi:hypothetical protein
MPWIVVRVCTATFTGWFTASGTCVFRHGPEQQGQGAFPLGAAGAGEAQRHRDARRRAGAGRRDAVGQRAQVEGLRLHHQPGRIDDLEQHLARVDHLAGHDVGRRDHAADRRHQRLGGRHRTAHRGEALLQAAHVGAGGIDVLLRHGAFELREPRGAAPGLFQLRAQFGRLGLLVGARYRLGGAAHDGQHLALAHRLAQLRQPARGRFDAAGLRRLHAAAGVGVHLHAARELQVCGSAFASASWVRTASWRCDGLGRNTLPSGSRFGALPAAWGALSPWSWPSPLQAGAAASASRRQERGVDAVSHGVLLPCAACARRPGPGPGPRPRQPQRPATAPRGAAAPRGCVRVVQVQVGGQQVGVAARGDGEGEGVLARPGQGVELDAVAAVGLRLRAALCAPAS